MSKSPGNVGGEACATEETWQHSGMKFDLKSGIGDMMRDRLHHSSPSLVPIPMPLVPMKKIMIATQAILNKSRDVDNISYSNEGGELLIMCSHAATTEAGEFRLTTWE